MLNQNARRTGAAGVIARALGTLGAATLLLTSTGWGALASDTGFGAVNLKAYQGAAAAVGSVPVTQGQPTNNNNSMQPISNPPSNYAPGGFVYPTATSTPNDGPSLLSNVKPGWGNQITTGVNPSTYYRTHLRDLPPDLVGLQPPNLPPALFGLQPLLNQRPSGNAAAASPPTGAANPTKEELDELVTRAMISKGIMTPPD